MPSEEKVQQVKELKEKLQKSTIVVSTAFTGLDGTTMTDLRQQFRSKGIEYRVVRNTLALIAAQEAGRPELKSLIQGSTGLALGYGDPVAVAKVLDEYVRSGKSALSIRGAILPGRALTPAELTKLTTLPGREVLVAQMMAQLQSPLVDLMSTLNTPIQALVNTLDQLISSLVWALQARVHQMEGSKS